ncbi:hypothetical protein M431DRAFT_453671 [Trichoderma harzianum CBS 226.95]|uniref:Uncharacterized protein n=1 Tax=Trichoderma harzianum CBS 226.95 TaxID=983964 RepID=A0A2T4AB10_TRIHA|nr:hypothetical protein M431DRAFT_453671 [Trichoderma harzianum CBS 226.95]PTB54261.1 hypothetical protein M431DRAFT_453671 [Trichoderma harzianum CBS 226.95]
MSILSKDFCRNRTVIWAVLKRGIARCKRRAFLYLNLLICSSSICYFPFVTLVKISSSTLPATAYKLIGGNMKCPIAVEVDNSYIASVESTRPFKIYQRAEEIW